MTLTDPHHPPVTRPALMLQFTPGTAHADGVLDAGSVQLLLAGVDYLTATTTGPVSVDLDGIRNIDSAAVGALFHSQLHAAASTHPLRIHTTNPAIRARLAICALDSSSTPSPDPGAAAGGTDTAGGTR